MSQRRSCSGTAKRDRVLCPKDTASYVYLPAALKPGGGWRPASSASAGLGALFAPFATASTSGRIASSEISGGSRILSSCSSAGLWPRVGVGGQLSDHEGKGAASVAKGSGTARQRQRLSQCLTSSLEGSENTRGRCSCAHLCAGLGSGESDFHFALCLSVMTCAVIQGGRHFS